ncbi:hypothetical protein Tco_1171930 [Tanacetum coccineum]
MVHSFLFTPVPEIWLSSPFRVVARAANTAVTPSSIMACSWALVTEVVVVGSATGGGVVVTGFKSPLQAAKRWQNSLSSRVTILDRFEVERGRIRAFEQETQDLDVEIKQMKDLKASYSVITPQELRRNQINEKISHHHSYGVTALSQLRRNLPR